MIKLVTYHFNTNNIKHELELQAIEYNKENDNYICTPVNCKSEWHKFFVRLSNNQKIVIE